jgi:hypothetical protein
MACRVLSGRLDSEFWCCKADSVWLLEVGGRLRHKAGALISPGKADLVVTTRNLAKHPQHRTTCADDLPLTHIRGRNTVASSNRTACLRLKRRKPPAVSSASWPHSRMKARMRNIALLLLTTISAVAAIDVTLVRVDRDIQLHHSLTRL